MRPYVREYDRDTLKTNEYAADLGRELAEEHRGRVPLTESELEERVKWPTEEQQRAFIAAYNEVTAYYRQKLLP